MTELKYGGNEVGKLMYGDEEISSGQFKLEPGTVIFKGDSSSTPIHLLSSGKEWEHIDLINVKLNFASNGNEALNKDISINDFPVTLESANRKVKLSKVVQGGGYALGITLENFLYSDKLTITVA